MNFRRIAWSLTASVLSLSNCWCMEPAALTATEEKWVQAADPVLQFAAAQGLPIDVIVQPTSTESDVPFAMGVQEHRCKLILSMRNRSDAETILRDVPLERHALLIEAMTAHEVAHCWRYIHGVWNTLPAGFVEPAESGDSEQLAEKKRQMRAVRREEGYADLVALAWTRRQHLDEYALVHAWLLRVRHDQPLAGSHHDTRDWLNLVRNPAEFAQSESPFEQVQALWLAGLRGER